MPASQSSQPVSAYLLLLILGSLPLIFVAMFYDDLPNRLVVHWGAGGHVTVIGTRAQSVMTIAIGCAGIALLAVFIAAAQNASFKSLGIRRLFLGLNFAQVITIGLTCAMLVGEALGFPIQVRDTVPPSAALLLAVAGLLCLRLSRGATSRGLSFIFGGAAWIFLAAAVAIIGLTLAFINTPLSWAAIGVAALATMALALPEPAS